MTEGPPVLIGEKVFWLGSGSGLPKSGKVKWLGKIAEIGPGWAVGVELDEELPYGGIDGSWGPRKLFDCKHKHGLIVPAKSLVSERRHLHNVVEEKQPSSARDHRHHSKDKSHEDRSRQNKKEDATALIFQKNNALSSGPSHKQSSERQASRAFETIPRDYLTKSTDRGVKEERGAVFTWMVDHQKQNERLVFKRMDIRRREFNRSFDEGLAFDSPRNSFHSSRSAGSKNRSSGLFALFKWFKKEKSEDSDFDVSSEQTSPVLPRATSITGSVDTLFSTATVNSFSYVHPLQYRPFGHANPPEIRIAVGPETNTYRNRIRERERLRYLEKNISLREKYRLYASGTLPRSADHLHELTDERIIGFGRSFDFPQTKNNTLGRKKKPAPPPPSDIASSSVNSIPGTSDHKGEIKQHRRALSEPVKYVKACHVKGKRKAPPPPGNSTDSDVISISTTNTNSSKRSRKKRRAPSPPSKNSDVNLDKSIVNIIGEVTNGVQNDEIDVNRPEELREETASNASTVDIGLADVVCTDTLKLEKGILKPNMDKPYSEPKICPSSPVSPRPWYKRTTSREGGSIRNKELKKERDRRKVEDWMLESGFPRRSLSNNDTRFNIFSKVDKADDKRKSQISILTNISELDREAAEIIKRGKEKEKTLIDSHNAMYYKNGNDAAAEETEGNAGPPDNPRKNSAKELISLFNAITNVTKVTVNSSFFAKDVSNKFNKDFKDKKLQISEGKYTERDFEAPSSSSQAVEVESFNEVVQRKFVEKPDVVIVEEKPGSSSASSSNGKVARATIDEIDEYDAERNSKSQVLYEANKQVRHLSPPIPTITEVSEGSAKSSPTSTIASNTSDLPADLPSGGQVTQVKNMNVWICPRCTLENLRWRITCEACDMWRPNPFELREKANKAINASKTEQTNKENKVVRNVTPSSKPLYPNLSGTTTNPEKDKLLSNVEGGDSVSDKTREKDQNILLANKSPTAQNNIINGFIPGNISNKSKLENGITYEKEPKAASSVQMKSDNIIDKGILIKSSSDFKKQSGQIISIQGENNVCTSVDNSKHKEKSETVLAQEPTRASVDTSPPAQNDILNEEVRKARIAFFNRNRALIQEKETTSNSADKEIENKNKITRDMEINTFLLDKENKNPGKPFGKGTEEKNKSASEVTTKNIVTNKEKVQSQNSNINLEVQTPTGPQTVQSKTAVEDDKQKLKEMLIEMKHSLPKRPKPVKKIESHVASEEKQFENKRPQTEHVKNVPSTSSNQTEPHPGKLNVSFNNVIPSVLNSDKAEAYLIESETVIEEIKLRKPSEKVSSSVQTSGLVTQISPKIQPPSGKEIFIPIKVEEHVIKDGILYTSTTREARKIGTGTFELMRPRDFANIKEIKTESKAGALPLYANTVDDDSNLSVKSEDATGNSSEYIDKLSKQLVKPQGVANFKARLDITNDKNMNTIAVNRLLKRLEGAIAGGNHELAAALARELAQLKVNCSVVRQKMESPGNEILAELYVEDKTSHQGPFHMKLKASMTVRQLKELTEREYEIPVRVQRWILGKQLAGDDSATLESLGVNTDGCAIFLYLVAPEPNLIKTEEVVEVEVKPSISANTPLKPQPMVMETEDVPVKAEIPVAGPSGVIIRKVEPTVPIETPNIEINPTGTLALGWKCEVCTLMNSPTRPGCAACSTGRPINYQVPQKYELSKAEEERISKEAQNEQQLAKVAEEEKVKNYQKLIDLEKDDLIIYPKEFECPVCLVEYQPTEGVVLRECLHVFCRTCLANTIHFSDEAEVKCPFRDNNYTCDSTLLEREIKALVTPQAYEEHLAKSIALAETKIGNAFHCKTPDCKGWCIYEDNVNIFKCPVCTHTNCLTCQAIHEGLNCKQFQEQLHSNSDMNIESKRTKEMLQEMVDRGEAMNCPTCQVVLMKKWGCDWLRCSMCKTEICWITRGPRWGPNGKGDTSGGCQCGVNGVKCHPKCTYCH